MTFLPRRSVLFGLSLLLAPLSGTISSFAADAPILKVVGPIEHAAASPLPRLSTEELKRHGRPLPDGRVASTPNGDVRQAWLSQPTDRYGHGVLGDAIEAGAVTARLADGSLVTYQLPTNSVFEDLEPRLGDLDGDGRTEIVLVRSFLKSGGSVAIIGIRDGVLTLLANTPSIGRTNRWLNPSILDDLDGSGRVTIGLVQTPHIGGQLQLWQFDGTNVALKRKTDGFSNHSIGSRALALSGVLTRGSSKRLLLPDASQSSLKLLDAQSLDVMMIIPLPARPVTGFKVSRSSDGRQTVSFGLADGKQYQLSDPAGTWWD